MQRNDRSYKDLKQKQKSAIADKIYKMYLKFYLENQRMPDATEMNAICKRLFTAVQSLAPKTEYEEFYKIVEKRKKNYEERILRDIQKGLYDDYKDGRMERDSYKQRAEKISVRLDEIKRKIEDAENSKKLLEQNELSDKIKLKVFLGIQKFDTEKLREIIKVIHVHSQDEIEIEWNFDDIFQNRDNLSRTKMTYQKIVKVLGLPDGSIRQSSAEKK